jgi:hypothetical protein
MSSPTSDKDNLAPMTAPAKDDTIESLREQLAAAQAKLQTKMRDDRLQALRQTQAQQAATDATRNKRLAEADARLKELACPVCLENSLDVTCLLCQHHVCMTCCGKIGAECPLCRSTVTAEMKAALVVNTFIKEEVKRLARDGAAFCVQELGRAVKDGEPLTEIKHIADQLSKRSQLRRYGGLDEKAEIEMDTVYNQASPIQRLAMLPLTSDIIMSIGRSWGMELINNLAHICTKKNEALLLKACKTCKDLIRDESTQFDEATWSLEDESDFRSEIWCLTQFNTVLSWASSTALAAFMPIFAACTRLIGATIAACEDRVVEFKASAESRRG